MKIRLLSEDVASRIAAGEVVERPASVIKELVENSLDAGATSVEVETRDGGKTLMRIRDNGEGMLSEEAELAFHRHATSKLQSASDLEAIATLGFRGEALASIAAVSRVTCSTRHATETAGTRLRIEGGAVTSQTPIGYPIGTEMVIEDLFYNVPARRKFLGAERSERRHIDAFLTRYAIAYPGVSFNIVHDHKEIMATPGNQDPREVLIKVYGLDLGASLLEIPASLTADTPFQVRGFAGPPTVHRADRGYITLFINGRWVQDLRLTYAIIQAYHTLLPVKRFPVAFVMVTMPLEEIDVNVHPAKTEVRFRDPDLIFRTIQRAVRASIIADAPVAASWQPASVPSNRLLPEESQSPNTLHALLSKLKPVQQFPLQEQRTEVPSDSSEPDADHSLQPEASGRSSIERSLPGAAVPSQSAPHLPPLRVIGQIATTFIVAEGPDGLYLIDQHAAHERVLYEQLLSTWAAGNVPAQPLLEPETVTLPLDEAGRLEETLPILNSLGLEIEPFGSNTFLVRAIPALLKHIPIQELVADIASGNTERSPVREGLEALTVRKICKRAAIKGGQVLSQEEMERLIHALEQTQNPRTCPHGRPTILQISVEQLAAQFKRG